MKRLLLGGALTLGLIGGAAGVIVHTGMLDIAADSPHYPLVYKLIETARDRAIDRRARAVTPPNDLADEGRVRRGAGNYAAMCAGCHLEPGTEDSEIRRGLYPAPPALTQPAAGQDADILAARRFWVIKHGVKASAMPAWAQGGMDDQAIWDLVAFLKVLPAMSAEQYRGVVAVSAGHAHGGMGHGD